MNTNASRSRAFHTSVVVGGQLDGPGLTGIAQRVTDAGFDALVMPDAVGYAPAVFPALTWVASQVPTLDVGTQVLNNDLRHPLHVAREAATLQSLSGGRFILGMGAGRDRKGEDLKVFGIPADPPGVRVSRLEASLDIIRRLFAGETVSMDGPYYTLDGASLGIPVDHGAPTLLLAGGGPRMLALGARAADVVSLGLDPLASWDDVRARLEIVRDAAAGTGRSPEIGFNLSGAGDTIHPWVRGRIGSDLDSPAVRDAPALVMGDRAAMTDHLSRLRDELGITRIALAVDFLDTLAPVLHDLR